MHTGMQQQKISNLVFVIIFGVHNVILTSFFDILMKLTKAWFNLFVVIGNLLIPAYPYDDDEETISKINLIMYNFKRNQEVYFIYFRRSRPSFREYIFS